MKFRMNSFLIALMVGQYSASIVLATENLHGSLDIFEGTGSDGGPVLQDYRPKLGASTLQDYRPDIAIQSDDFPAISAENFGELLSALHGLNVEADRMPGAWVAGNLALGANQDEYVPSVSEISAAVLGDRISALIATIDPDVLARLWPADRSRFLSYNRFEIRHVDVLGSGRFYYSSAPIEVNLEIWEVSK